MKKLTQEEAQDIAHKIDEVSSKKLWESSGFLRAVNKKLKALKEIFLQASVVEEGSSKVSSRLEQRISKHNDYAELYVSLYSSEGDKISAWERILYNLSKHVISRPIYDNEENIKKLIKSKENPHNEAYIAIMVQRSDLLPPIRQDKVLQDRLGQPLLTLKDNSILLNNVKRFVHVSGVYEWQKNKLFKID